MDRVKSIIKLIETAYGPLPFTSRLAACNTLEIQAKVDEREFAALNCCVKDTVDAFHTYPQ